MKKTMFGLVAVFALSVTAGASDPSTLGKKYGLSFQEAVSAVTLAKRYNMDVEDVIRARRTYGTRIDNLAPAFHVSRSTGMSLGDVFRERRRGYAWGDIPCRHGGRHEGVRYRDIISDRDFEDLVWRSTLDNQWRVSEAEARRYRNMGMSWGDIAATAYSAREFGVDRFETARNWQEGRQWDKVRSRLRAIGLSAKGAKDRRISLSPSLKRKPDNKPKPTLGQAAKAQKSKGKKKGGKRDD